MFVLAFIAYLLAFAQAEGPGFSKQDQNPGNSIQTNAGQQTSGIQQNYANAAKQQVDNKLDRNEQYTQETINTQVLENPTYDPNLYHSFLPNDGIYNYISQYGALYPASNAVATAPVIAAGYPAPSGYVQPGTFALQTGYEGYLVPEVAEAESSDSSLFGLAQLIRGMQFTPRNILSWIARTGTYILSSLSVVLFGGAITTAVCTFTPLCSITFAALPFLRLRDSAENLGKTIATEITPERVRRTAEFLEKAIEKFQSMQQDSKSHEAQNESIQKIEKKFNDE